MMQGALRGNLKLCSLLGPRRLAWQSPKHAMGAEHGGGRGAPCATSTAQGRAEAAIAEVRKGGTKEKAAHESPLAEAGAAAKRYEEVKASLKALQNDWVMQAQQLQLREDDLKACDEARGS
ncbi:hypothetical protein D1007_30533 [Hordeum vulgare]|nr:hypothetical protein D1007_30533 [Hordeum vulgare]